MLQMIVVGVHFMHYAADKPRKMTSRKFHVLCPSFYILSSLDHLPAMSHLYKSNLPQSIHSEQGKRYQTSQNWLRKSGDERGRDTGKEIS